MNQFNINLVDGISQLVIKLSAEQPSQGVRVEAASINYLHGNLQVQNTVQGFSNNVSQHYRGDRFFKPLITGSGTVYLKPTMGLIYKLEVADNTAIVINPNYFCACDATISLQISSSYSLFKLIQGVPNTRLLASGMGNIYLYAPGEVQKVDIKDSALENFASFEQVLAYTDSIQVIKKSLAKPKFGSFRATDKMFFTYKGSGTLYFSPMPSKDYARNNSNI